MATPKITRPRKKKWFALWHGEEYLTQGTVSELAEYIGCAEATVYGIINRSKTIDTPNRYFALEMKED